MCARNVLALGARSGGRGSGTLTEMRTPRCTTVGVWRWVRLSTMSMKSLAVGTCQPGAGLVLSAPPQRRRRHRRRKERRRRETHRRYLFKVVQHHGRINFKRSGVGPPLLSAVAWRTKLTHSASQSLAPQPERYQRTRASAAVDAMNFLFFPGFLQTVLRVAVADPWALSRCVSAPGPGYLARTDKSGRTKLRLIF